MNTQLLSAWSVKNNISTRLAIIIGENIKSLENYIKEQSVVGYQPFQIYEAANEINPYITKHDIAMSYVGILYNQSNEDILTTVNNVYQELVAIDEVYLNFDTLLTDYQEWVIENKINFDNNVTTLYKWRRAFQVQDFQALTLIEILSLPENQVLSLSAIEKKIAKYNDLYIYELVFAYYYTLLDKGRDIVDALMQVNNSFGKAFRKAGISYTVDSIYQEYRLWSNKDSDKVYTFRRITSIPVKFMIAYPRNKNFDKRNIINGNSDYIFDYMFNIITDKINNQSGPAEIYDFIMENNPATTMHDLVMSYKYVTNYSSQWTNDWHQKITDIPNDIYLTNQDLSLQYEQWLEQIAIKSWTDDRRFDAIIETQSELVRIEQEVDNKLNIGPTTINSAMKKFNPTINNRQVTVEDGYDIFNRAKLSRYVPFIVYNDDKGNSFYRVYTKGKTESEPDYKKTILNRTPKNNTIYINIWLGDPNQTMEKSLKDASEKSFQRVVYYLEENNMVVEYPISPQLDYGPIIKDFLASTFEDNLELGTGQEIKVIGDFDIWNLAIEEYTFLDLVLNDPILNKYLYIEENDGAFAIKKKLIVHYRSLFTDLWEGKTVAKRVYISNYAPVSVTLTQKELKVGQKYQIINEDEYETDEDMDYVHVNITQAENGEYTEDFARIFPLLLQYYLLKKPEVEYLYKDLIEIKENAKIINLTKEQEVKKGRKQKMSPNNVISAPELFVPNYTGNGCNDPPILIEDSEIDYYEELGKQVMRFPIQDPRWNFVCPDETPFPGVKVNSNLPNKDLFPYIVCCYKKDQHNKTKYKNYEAGILPVFNTGAKGNKIISSNKTVEADATAEIPVNIKNTLAQYSEDSVKMMRYGTIGDQNSLLHCVCTAIDDPNYLILDDENKSKYVYQLRRLIAININPAVCKQEMYDYSVEEIQALINKKDVFLDPDLFYRLVEEAFQINIYTFSVKDDIVIPRHKMFHARPIRLLRPTILIMKLTEQRQHKSSKLIYPKCELIIDYDQDNYEVVKVFGQSMTEICHNIIAKVRNTYTWDESIVCRQNIYYQIDHEAVYGFPVKHQYIDNYGKMRALTFDKLNNNFTVITIPSQPGNYPISEEIINADDLFITNILGFPNSANYVDGKIVGLWYQILDIKNGEYIPVKPVSVLTKPKTTAKITKAIPLPSSGPISPIITDHKPSLVARLHEMRRILKIFTQLVKWLYSVSKLNKVMTPYIFAAEYMTFNEKFTGDSVNYYNLSKVNQRLPEVTDISLAIRYLKGIAPSMFQEDKLLMYDEKFYKHIIEMLIDFDNTKRYKYKKNRKINNIIENFYEYESDFVQYDNSKLFISTSDLNKWLKSIENNQQYGDYYVIKHTVHSQMSKFVNPYLVQDSDGKIYLIQNTTDGYLNNALNVAVTWNETAKINRPINLGVDAGEYLEDVEYVLYGLSPSGIVILDHQDVDLDKTIKILFYGNKADFVSNQRYSYAAMIPVL